MTATAAAVPVAARAPSWRYAAWAALLVSFFFLLWDGFNAVARLDLVVELFARVVMIAVAGALLIRWRDFARHGRLASFLVWGLIGLSLDVYWQTAYDSDTAMLRLGAMLLKYAGISAGLGSFIALTASFGNGDRHGIRRAIATYAAPGFAGALFVAGVAHGVLWLQACGAPGVCFGVVNPLAIFTYRLYLAFDVAARMLIVVSAWTGVVWSTRNGERLLSIALASTTVSLATAIDFATRLGIASPGLREHLAIFQPNAYEQFLQRLQIADSLGTLMFAAILALALLNRTLFGLSRYAMYAFTASLFLIVLGTVEGSSHYYLSRFFEPLGIGDFQGTVVLAVSFTFVLHKPEEWMLERIDRLRGDVKERMDQLRELRTKIGTFTDAHKLEQAMVDAMTRIVEARFAQLFLRHRTHGYRARASSPQNYECALTAITDKELPRDLLQRFVPVEMETDGCLKGAVLALPMPVAGKLYGFLACGLKDCEDEDCYTELEKEEIASLAREAGGALHALGAHR